MDDGLLKAPEKVNFQNEAEVLAYQTAQVHTLLKFYRLPADPKIITTMPEPDPRCREIVTLKTSGTTAHRRTYYYPSQYYAAVEQFHFHRLMAFNQIEKGNCVLLKNDQGDPAILHGPTRSPAFGDNEIYVIFYGQHERSRDEWEKLFRAADRLRPKFWCCTPSELTMLSQHDLPKRNCPVITTGETLHDHVRGFGNRLFSRVIDKMRCWDGGMSFFECHKGRKHIYDELCYVEQVEGSDQLASTDFFNTCQPFIRYHNGDRGTVKIGKCECGIFGHYFDSFTGKSLECLISVSNRRIPGRAIINTLCDQLQTENEFGLNIKQEINGRVIVRTNHELTPKTRGVITKVLATLVNDSPYAEPFKISFECHAMTDPHARKHLLVRSDRYTGETTP